MAFFIYRSILLIGQRQLRRRRISPLAYSIDVDDKRQQTFCKHVLFRGNDSISRKRRAYVSIRFPSFSLNVIMQSCSRPRSLARTERRCEDRGKPRREQQRGDGNWNTVI